MNEAQLQFALNVSRTGMWNRDLRTNQLVWTDQCRALFGLPPGEPVSHERFVAALHPADRERVLQTAEQSLAEHTEFHTEYRVIWPDGSQHWLIDRGRGIYDELGRPIQIMGVTVEVTELKQAEEALHETELRFRRLVNSNIIGITIGDLHGKIHEANDAFLSLVGYTREDVEAGRLRWIELAAPEYRAHKANAIKELKETGSFAPTETEYITREGRRIPALSGGTLFRREPEELAICFILDLSARKAIEEQKDLFLGITGHELRTPLTALKGTLQLLQRRTKRLKQSGIPSSPEEKTFFEELEGSLAASLRQVDIQARLISDLLDISKITADTLELARRPYDLVKIVRQIVADVRMTAPNRDILLDLPLNQEVSVLIDRDRISQVVTNYLTNALRYSPPEKPVQVGLTLHEGKACVWVRDQGPGLSEEEQQRVWQRFHRGKGTQAQSNEARVKGLGLGLYISQRLIAQHGGEVGVESEPGKGATFWFTLSTIA